MILYPNLYYSVVKQKVVSSCLDANGAFVIYLTFVFIYYIIYTAGTLILYYLFYFIYKYNMCKIFFFFFSTKSK